MSAASLPPGTPIPPGTYTRESVTVTYGPLPPGGDAGNAIEPLPALAAPRRLPWTKIMLGALAILVVGGSALALVDWVTALLARSPWLGGTVVALVVAAIGSAGLAVHQEWRQIRRFDAVGRLRARAAARMNAETRGEGAAIIGQILAALPQDPALEARATQLKRMIHDALGDRQAFALFHRTILKPLDERAQAVVVRAARDAAVGVSISPVAMLDVAITIWRSVRMIRQIAAVYGFRPGTTATVVLARRVLVSAATNAAIDIAGTVWSEHLGHRVAGVLSQKLAEGVITAIRTARLGLATMEACRPLPFGEAEQPTLASLRQQVIKGLTS
jgi:putative membrane protein